MSVEVRPVRTRRELNTFIKLPWRLYRDEPNWVAPLLMDVKKRLDRKKNPFFKHAEAQYFLAYRDGSGRVRARAAIPRRRPAADIGIDKAMDLYMWSLDVEGREKVHPAIWEMADKLESEHGIVCRNFKKKDLQDEVTRVYERVL